HTSIGALSDALGNFIIRAGRGDTLIFSSTGYAPHEIVVDNRTEYNITLGTDVQSWENVVVIGYGSKKKQNLTGAVSTVGSEVFQSKPITTALPALQGEIPGT